MAENDNAAGSYVADVMRRVAAVEVAARSRPGGGEAGRARRRAGFDLVTVRTGRLGSDGEMEVKTTPGYLTERRRAPSALAKLPHDHPFVRVASQYCSLSEMVGAVRGADIEVSGGGGASDGGAAARADDARRLTILKEAIGDGVALRGIKGCGVVGASVVTDMEVVDALLVRGLSIDAVLRASGRKPQSARPRAQIRAALDAALERMAKAFDYQTG